MKTRREQGTTAVEMTVMAPIVLLVALALAHGALAIYGITATQTAARQAARAFSLNEDPAAAARDALPGWLPSVTETFGPDHGVIVRVDLPDVVPGTELIVTRRAELP